MPCSSSPRPTGCPGTTRRCRRPPRSGPPSRANIDKLNATLNRWETIKKFTILTRDLTEENGELTTSLKVKRKVVEQHFADQLDAMYA